MTSRVDWVTRPEAVADIPVIREVLLSAFDTAEEAGLVDAFRKDESWIPELSTVATDTNGQIVGYALLTRCHIGEVPALCLGPCAVVAERQKSGAGSAAIRAGLAAAEEMGEQFVTVLGHPTYYPRFGFTRASAHGIRMKTEVPDEALMALSLGTSPLPSGTIRYAAPFGDI